MNVADEFAGMSVDQIREILAGRRFNFSILIQNLQHDLNIGNIIRSANAFGADNIYIYGKKKFDRRGCVGTHHYGNIKYVKSVSELPDVPLIGVDNVSGAKPLNDFRWSGYKFILAFGTEKTGLTEDILVACKELVYIKQFGSVRSLNVASAASIIMYDITNKLNRS